jgi:integrase
LGERHANDVLASLEQYVFPSLRNVPIIDIAEPQVLAVVRGVEARSKETARRVRQRIEAIFNFAMSTGRAKTNPAAVVKGAMAPMKKGKQPAITDLDKAREMLQKAEAEKRTPCHEAGVAHPRANRRAARNALEYALGGMAGGC